MKTTILTLALGASVMALAFTPATSASAQPAPQTFSARVKYSDLNLSTREGAKAMYQRIKSTARSLCGEEPDIGEVGGIDAWRTCVSDAVNNAVGRLDAPMVTAFNGGRSASTVKLAQAR
jgi:UrcA family protein